MLDVSLAIKAKWDPQRLFRMDKKIAPCTSSGDGRSANS
jgi:hypothetical protein